MYGFCGWVGPERWNTQHTTEAVSRTLAPGSDIETIEFVPASGQALLCKGLYPIDTGIEGKSMAIVLGTPAWSDDRLKGLAREQGPAAALVSGYTEMGHAVLQHMHGPFAVAVRRGEQALLAVDRVGVHTLSYGLKDGVFAFGTSARSVAAHPAFGLELDPQALYHFFYFSEVPSPGTVYPGVEKLQPAQYVELSGGRLQRDFYWTMHYADSGTPPLAPLAGQFRGLLDDAVRRCYDGPPGAAFLSGGTDSSTITGVLSTMAEGPVHTYSMGFAVDGFDEMEYARAAVQKFAAAPHEFYVTPEDVLSTLPIVAQAYDEPFGNESAVSAYLCASRARADGVRVMLAGDGGDELFGGNTRYSKQMVFERYFQAPALLRRGLLEPLVFAFPMGRALWPVRKARSYIEQARIPLPDRLETYNHLHRSPLEFIFEPEFLDGIDPGRPLEMLRDVYSRTQSEHPINRMAHLDLKFTLADNDLRKVSRMCEAAGVEVRYPLLDEALLDFSGKLPPDYRVRGSQLRWFFKEALKDFLPASILSKSKHGFGLPFGQWALSHPLLREQMESLTDAFAARGIMRPEYLQDIRRRHAQEHATFYGTMLWNVAMLEAWFQAHDY